MPRTFRDSDALADFILNKHELRYDASGHPRVLHTGITLHWDDASGDLKNILRTTDMALQTAYRNTSSASDTDLTSPYIDHENHSLIKRAAEAAANNTRFR